MKFGWNRIEVFEIESNNRVAKILLIFFFFFFLYRCADIKRKQREHRFFKLVGDTESEFRLEYKYSNQGLAVVRDVNWTW